MTEQTGHDTTGADRPAPIEITPAMIDAGVRTYLRDYCRDFIGQHSDQEMVEMIYRAMRAARHDG